MLDITSFFFQKMLKKSAQNFAIASEPSLKHRGADTNSQTFMQLHPDHDLFKLRASPPDKHIHQIMAYSQSVWKKGETYCGLSLSLALEILNLPKTGKNKTK